MSRLRADANVTGGREQAAGVGHGTLQAQKHLPCLEGGGRNRAVGSAPLIFFFFPGGLIQCLSMLSLARTQFGFCKSRNKFH